MGMIEFISEVIMGIGILLIAGQAIGYFTTSLGVLGYAVGGGVFVVGLILFIFASKRKSAS